MFVQVRNYEILCRNFFRYTIFTLIGTNFYTPFRCENKHYSIMNVDGCSVLWMVSLIHTSHGNSSMCSPLLHTVFTSPQCSAPPPSVVFSPSPQCSAPPPSVVFSPSPQCSVQPLLLQCSPLLPTVFAPPPTVFSPSPYSVQPLPLQCSAPPPTVFSPSPYSVQPLP